MAEPIILSYARGLLREFPGVPEGVVDVIPVDLVVAAIIATGRTARPEGRGTVGEPDIVQVATGDANPLQYQRLVDNVRDWFTEHPLYDDHGQPIVVPGLELPGPWPRRVASWSVPASVLRATERIVSAVPIRGRAAAWGAPLEERRAQLDRAGTYVELYGAYTECEAVYAVDHLLALSDAMDDDERAGARDRPPGHRVGRLHPSDPPAVGGGERPGTLLARPADGAGRRTERLRAQVLAPERQMAAFDLENTLIASNVVTSYSWLATRRLSSADRVRFALRTLAEAPSLLAAGPCRPLRLPALVLPTLRGSSSRAARRGRARALQPGAPGTFVPCGDPAGA